MLKKIKMPKLLNLMKVKITMLGSLKLIKNICVKLNRINKKRQIHNLRGNKLQ